MPRTTTLEPSGCPPVKLVTADELGFIKVFENDQAFGSLNLISRYGEGTKSQSIKSFCMPKDNSQNVAVGRADGMVEVLNYDTGEKKIIFEEIFSSPIVHLFTSNHEKCIKILTASSNGEIQIRKFIDDENINEKKRKVNEIDTYKMENIKSKYKIIAEKSNNVYLDCLKMNDDEKQFSVGGKGLLLSTYDVETEKRIWASRNVKPDFLNIVPPPHITALLYPEHKNPNRILTGTAQHCVRLYDVAAQRREIMTIDFGESIIKSLEASKDGNTIFVGDGMGNLAHFDLRNGLKIGGFKGRFAGSIRSIAAHPHLPIIASCGLDRFVRIHHIETRELLTRCFLKQPGIAVSFDTISTFGSNVEVTSHEELPVENLKKENNENGGLIINEDDHHYNNDNNDDDNNDSNNNDMNGEDFPMNELKKSVKSKSKSKLKLKLKPKSKLNSSLEKTKKKKLSKNEQP